LGDIYIPSLDGALRQGEILTGIVQVRLAVATLGTDQKEIEEVVHPYAIVLSQDCDLDWDWRGRTQPVNPGEIPGQSQQKLLPSILFGEMTTAEALRVLVNSTIWGRIRLNKDERYQFLQAVSREDDVLGEGLPELGMDFKRYFTVPTDEVYGRLQGGEARRRCRFKSPYLEHLSTRFCYYQFRVALPQDHESAPALG
jgi:hypothetical protein